MGPFPPPARHGERGRAAASSWCASHSRRQRRSWPDQGRPPPAATRRGRLRRARWQSRTFFERPAEASQGARHRRLAQVHPLRRFPPRAVLGQRRIRMALDLGRQRGNVVRCDPPGPSRTEARCHAAALPLSPSPALDGGGPDAEEAGGLGLAEPGVDGAQQPLAEVDRLLPHPHELRMPSCFLQEALRQRSVHLAER